jgi:hypothetical protein
MEIAAEVSLGWASNSRLDALPKTNGGERNGTSTKYGAKDRRDYTDQRTPPIVVRKHHGVGLTPELSCERVN